MQLSVAVGTLIILALFSANLPFINQRIFACIPTTYPKKPFWVRLLEWIALYFLLGAVAYFFESSLGNVFAQGWEFYVVTLCLFMVLAFPGFIFQYLRRS